MLQRSLIRTHFCVKDHEYVIERTKESKPYAMSPIKQFGEWNYNVSHQGDLVAIVSHGSRPIGVDLVELNSRNHNVAKTINEYVRMFEMQLAKQEMDYILKCSKQTFAENAVHTDINFPNSISEEDFKYQKFYIVWALKEAFSKALGFGLSFDLRQAVFEVRFDRFEAAGTWPANGAALCFCSGSAILTLSGQRRPDWSLRFNSIDARHLMAIAQGPSQSLHAGCVGDLHLEWKSVGSLRS
jgi:phosphopantetheinyl transferase